MKWYMRRRALLLAALATGTTLQLSTCAEQASLFGLQVGVSSFTLPLNRIIVQFFTAIAQASPFVLTI